MRKHTLLLILVALLLAGVLVVAGIISFREWEHRTLVEKLRVERRARLVKRKEEINRTFGLLSQISDAAQKRCEWYERMPSKTKKQQQEHGELVNAWNEVTDQMGEIVTELGKIERELEDLE